MNVTATACKTALITGGNKGIGFAIATGLGKQGYSLWVGARDVRRGQRAVGQLVAMGINARLLLIDVTDDESVNAAARRVLKESGHLDILVNNAGIILGADASPLEQSLAEVKAVYEVNVFGVIRVTQAFVPALRKSESARVVIIGSGLGSLGLVNNAASIYSTANFLAYNSSKTAVNAVAVSFAKALAPDGIKVNVIEPGSVATDLNEHQGALTPDEGASVAIRLATIGDDGPTGGFFGHEGVQPW
ncbi:SDR family oxidoreductase [Pseudomonas sp. GD03842]|uniref:SDR family oxidoreductase n=1 Tax=Pseudomonas sp. GD03842 TaxID=2975385 RepID=UPI0024477FBA|nr:SDR family oxidoreductase [Pseudomonas sp. GD03842]MDH0746905.1 SDR family oxidoreductase [Pseudomonas sp. GD03842]